MGIFINFILSKQDLDSIEILNEYLKWELISIKMPFPSHSFSLLNLFQSTILILGGIKEG